MKKISILLLGCCISIQAQESKKVKAYMVSDAHFDTQWNWDVQTSIREYIPKTLRQNLMLLEKYPNYIFNFEGAVKYSWMKEYYPLEYEAMKKYVKEGRWHVCGSTWDATDANIPSSESFIRNIMYGQNYYEKEFGVRSKDIFLPDCFGFGWTLPSIAAHCGLIGFSTQKLQWRNNPFYGDRKIPFEIGLWQGIDGSKIMLAADGHNYTSKLKDEDISQSKSLYDKINATGIGIVYHYYGTGDTGGAPTIESVRAIEKGVNGDGPIEIISAYADQMYEDYYPFENHKELPVFNGELLMDVHGTGCYTSQAAMKLFNRRNEQLAVAAERSSVAADYLGEMTYPTENLANAWKRVIWHQFHDDLTGTSIPRAYEFSWNDELISLNQFQSIGSAAIGAVARNLDTRTSGEPAIIYNPTIYEVEDIVKINDKYLNIKVPSMGFVVVDRKAKTQSTSKVKATITNGKASIENSVYKVELDANGDICSIVDKRNGKEIVAEGHSIRLALITDNPSKRWPAWEIMKTTNESKPIAISENVKLEVSENNSITGAIKIERNYGESHFVQYVRLNEGGQADRIDIFNEIDWASTNCLLKAAFPFSFSNKEASYDLSLGNVKRGNNTLTAYEVYGHQWADLSSEDGSYGVTILNDCKYGWDKPADNVLRLTLLHTPGVGSGYKYQAQQDMGHHVFTYSIIGHEGVCDAGIATKKAEILNQPLQAYRTTKHKGTLGKEFSLGDLNSEGVRLMALKKAEDGNGYIVRFQETAGKKQKNVKFNFAGKIIEATAADGTERPLNEKIALVDDGLSFDIEPYSLKTIRFKAVSTNSATDKMKSEPLDIPYNVRYTTYNAFRNTVSFDGTGNSYAAELIPGIINWRGVEFKLAPADTINSVKCRGQEIAIPSGCETIYLLAASTSDDIKCKIKVGATEKFIAVPAYNGFIGQWGHTNHTEGFVKNTEIAWIGTHTHNSKANEDVPYQFTYMFAIPVSVPKNATTMTFPNNPKIRIFAATAVYSDCNTVTPAIDLQRVGIPGKEAKEDENVSLNLAFNCEVIDKSGQIHEGEAAELALDEDPTTKWCDTSSNSEKYITVDLREEKTIRYWQVLHAGRESKSYITRDFCLQVKLNANDSWETVDSVSGNTENHTDRALAYPVKARYVRLLITKAEEGSNTVRIYEFGVKE